MTESLNYTRVYKNVKKNQDLNWQEKAILSEIITAQVQGKTFVTTDLQLAKALDIDMGNVNKYIRQLAKRGIILRDTKSLLSHSGGKPKRQRTIVVVDIESWTHDNKKPVFELFNEPKPVRKPKKVAKRKSTKKAKEAVTDTITPVDKESTISIDKTPVIEDMRKVEPITLHFQNAFLNNNKDLEEFINSNPNYLDLPVIHINIDFEDGELLASTAYVAKVEDGIKRYILAENIISFLNKTGIYKEFKM